jgi:hypothetical protein
MDSPISYLDKVIECKRASYGPWGLYQLPSGAWAAVWEFCLDDEDACRRIYEEDPTWFNGSTTRDGRPPNPTYASQFDAQVEISRALVAEIARVGPEPRVGPDLGRQLLLVRADMSVDLTDWNQSATYPWDQEELREALTEGAGEVHLGPFPWECATGTPKGISIKLPATSYAKLQWVCDNVPRMSLQRIAREGAEAYADRLVALHFNSK